MINMAYLGPFDYIKVRFIITIISNAVRSLSTRFTLMSPRMEDRTMTKTTAIAAGMVRATIVGPRALPSPLNNWIPIIPMAPGRVRSS